MNPGSFRIIVTGSRDWSDVESVRTPLDELLRQHARPDSPLLISNGKAAKGLDALVTQWVRGTKGLAREIPFPAPWSTLGPKAGPLRNQAMVNAGADALLAWANPCRKADRKRCPDVEHPSHGTADCVERAKAADIQVFFCPTGMRW